MLALPEAHSFVVRSTCGRIRRVGVIFRESGCRSISVALVKKGAWSAMVTRGSDVWDTCFVTISARTLLERRSGT